MEMCSTTDQENCEEREPQIEDLTLFETLYVIYNVHGSVIRIAAGHARRFWDEVEESFDRSRSDFVRAVEDVRETTASEGPTDTESLPQGVEDIAKKILAPLTGGLLLDGERKIVSQMTLVFAISHLEAFLRKYIRYALPAFPERLKSRKQVEYNEIIDSGGWNELLGTLAEKEVAGIGRKVGFAEWDTHFSEKWGFQLSGDERWDTILEAVERRHVLVHRGGRPDERYFVRTGAEPKEILSVPIDYLEEVVEAVLQLMAAVHSHVPEKLDLERLVRTFGGEVGLGALRTPVGRMIVMSGEMSQAGEEWIVQDVEADSGSTI